MEYTDKLETFRDLKNQREIAEAVARRFKAELVPMIDYSINDYVLYDEAEPVGILEVKNRPEWKDSSTFPTYRVSARKYLQLKERAKLMRVPLIFAFRCANGDILVAGWTQVRPSRFVENSGRTRDTRFPEDIETMAEFPIEGFFKLKDSHD